MRFAIFVLGFFLFIMNLWWLGGRGSAITLTGFAQLFLAILWWITLLLALLRWNAQKDDGAKFDVDRIFFLEAPKGEVFGLKILHIITLTSIAIAYIFFGLLLAGHF